MKRVPVLLLLAGAALLLPLSQQLLSQKNATPFAGRWDLTFTDTKANTYPGWFELAADGKLRFQPRGGSVFAVKDVTVEGDKLTFAPWKDVKIVFTPKGKELAGELWRGDKREATAVALPAPELNRPMPKRWSKPEPLFNGKDLTGWEPDSTKATNRWVAKDGALVNEGHGVNLRSTRKLDDFKLHIEFNCPDGGNSGLYLRGRYEIQIEYEKTPEDPFHMMGAIYGFVAPAAKFEPKPGQWESYDITFVGRRLTLYRNGVKSIDNVELPGITGGALDSKEGEPGPIYIQGDHTGGLMFRNITVQVPSK